MINLIFTNKENENLFSKAEIGNVATWDTSRAYSEEGIYNFLTEHINDKSIINILLIDCSLGKIITDYLGIRLGLLVRLISSLGDNRYLPIIFFSSENEESIRAVLQKNTRETLAPFFVSEGCYFVDFSSEEIRQKLSKVKKIDKDTLNTIFNKVSIKNLETSSSHHAFTNQWGVWKLAQATGNKDTLLANTEFQKAYKTLYFQYLIAKDKVSLPSQEPKIKCQYKDKNGNIINATSKKILLIDDDAQKGWYDVLNKIFGNTTSVFQCITTKEQAETKIANSDFVSETDIVLLDVRLTDEDRKNNTKVTEFSGYKLLKKIKAKNKGIQVIIFTASNKAWNMKHLVEAGADGYYIKESPDFQYEENYAQENFNAFQEEIERAVEKADFLKWFWKNTQDLISHTNIEYANITDSNNTPNYAQGFINSIKLSLDYAYDTIANYHSQTETQKYLNYAFVGYCNLIEYVLNQLFKQEIFSAVLNKYDYKLKATSSTGETNIIIAKIVDYDTQLEYRNVNYNSPITITSMPFYYKSSSNINLTDSDFARYYNNLPNLQHTFAALILLRYQGFNKTYVQEYEFLKRKRNDFMHENLQNLITLPDCKDIFRMVYIVLKGVNL